MLRNTWEGVAEIRDAYPGGVLPWVLDDGWDDEVREMAREFGFGYIRRTERIHKKAGNLRCAFARTSAPSSSSSSTPTSGPARTSSPRRSPTWTTRRRASCRRPQFFRSLAYADMGRAGGGGVTLEVFYRSVQQARDRFGSALCVGSNALYRREALEPSGGCFLIPYAEDSHTGLDARAHGYQLDYLPVPLAAGICPPGVDAFMRQQYRWCNGAT